MKKTSPFWKKKYNIYDGLGAKIGDFYAFIKDSIKKTVKTSRCCPCYDWSIVNLCPSNVCGVDVNKDIDGYPISPPLPNFIGRIVEQTTEFETKILNFQYGSNTVEAKVLDVLDCAANSPWECVSTPQDSFLVAIRHETKKAPSYTGEVEAKVYINGALVKTLAPEVYTPDQKHILGEDLPGSNFSYKVIQLNHLFDQDGIHDLDLIVTFKSSGNEPDVIYTCRKEIRMYFLPTGVSFSNQPFVAPDWTVGITGGSGGFRLLDPSTNMVVNAYVHRLKGPFKNKDDADWVINNWDSQIQEYVNCDFYGCGPKSCYQNKQIGYNFLTDLSIVGCPGVWEAEGYGGVGDAVATFGCEVPYYLEISLGKNMYISSASCGRGKKITSSGKYTLPACEYYTIFTKVKPPDGVAETPVDWSAHGEWYSINTGSSAPCKWCNNEGFSDPSNNCHYHLDDNEGFWFSDWDYRPRCSGGPSGIPNNSAELADFNGTTLIVCVHSVLLSELPKELQ